MPFTSKITEKQFFFVTKLLLAGFYLFYILGMLIGLTTDNRNFPTPGARFYNLEYITFANSAWSYFHIFSLIAVIAIIVFIVLAKEPKDLLKNRMLYSLGAYLTLVGITIFALGCLGTFRFEIASITTMIFGVILWFTPLIEKAGRINATKSSLIKGIGSFLYFIGLSISTFNAIVPTNTSSLNYIYNTTINLSTRAFYPTIPDWIFGGLIWLLLAFYWSFDFIESKGIIKKTKNTKSVLLTFAVIIYKVELFIFVLFFVNFGVMSGAAMITMFVGNMLGFLAVVSITILLLMKLGMIVDASVTPKAMQEPLEPSTLDTEETT